MADASASTWKELPATVPHHVRDAVKLSEHTLELMLQGFDWGATPAFVLEFRRPSREADIQLNTKMLDFGPEVSRTVDLVNAVANTLAAADLPGDGSRVGLAMMSEFVDQASEWNDVPLDQLRDHAQDLVAAGVTQGRAIVATIAEGWRFAVVRRRHETEPEIAVYAPDTPWPDGLRSAGGALSELAQRLPLRC